MQAKEDRDSMSGTRFRVACERGTELRNGRSYRGPFHEEHVSESVAR